VAGRLDGRVAIITGASTGIGYAAARRFLAEGAFVGIMSRREDRLAAAAQLLGEPQRVLALAGDVAEPADVDRLVSGTLDRFGRLDVAVSNAGIHRLTPFLEVTDGEWDEVMQINLRGSFLLCRSASQVMRDQGHGGSIVLVASTNGFVAEPGMAAYNASKGGLLMLVRSMAVDLAPYRIRVNAVAPGTVLSEITRPMLAGGFSFGSIPLRRVGDAEEVAAPILFLATDEASYITGATLVVDGGQTAMNGEGVGP
jgi:NAD(P)-dependent dehydrogenase (short-subunit alcohol dehydrogenase family)